MWFVVFMSCEDSTISCPSGTEIHRQKRRVPQGMGSPCLGNVESVPVTQKPAQMLVLR